MNTFYTYKNERIIGVDIETKDPFLKQKGPGVYRKDGYILGVSFSNGELSEYYPLAHPDTSAEEKEKNLQYIKTQLALPVKKVFANCQYDLDWLINGEYGMSVAGEWHDIQLAEPLIDEYASSYSLNSLSLKYLEDVKKEDAVREYGLANNLIKPNEKTAQAFWKMPGEALKLYASEDARLTYEVFRRQLPILEVQDLLEVYELERRIIPLLLQMRKRGVRVDTKRLFQTGRELSDLSYDLQTDLDELAGFSVNVNSGKDLERLFTMKHIPVVYGEPTDLMLQKGIFRGNPKFDKQTLSQINNSLVSKILELRHIKTLLSLFIHPYPDLLVGDRLHCQFHPLRSDDYGTVSGRFSSSSPNLQQVSAKKEDHEMYSGEILNGLVIRKLFIPEENCDWCKLDWSQIEYRFIAHYALGEGAELIRKRYNEDPHVDYHDEMGKMSGIDERKIVKTLNFGAAYGMGVEKMSRMYNWNLHEAEMIYKQYHSRVPFIKETSRRVGAKAKRAGYIRTILNRRARLPHSSKTYIMFNRLIQGSAADLMKKAMHDAYYSGIFEVLHPHITVHDELDISVPRTKASEEALKELKRIMENCIPIKVPIKVDIEKGSSWGELDKLNLGE